MSDRLGASFAATAALFLATTLLSLPARAADLPEIKTSDSNTVPACVTPGRLQAYLEAQEGDIAEKYNSIAVEYMRHGEDLALRWDIAFFQMMVETGSLTYKGDVKPDQNNFAGLGATGRGARGESFKSVSDGVRAHLQHVLLYAGEKIDNPVAERTRNIQDWGVLTKWQQSIKGPMTYQLLTKKWAPTSRGYARDIAFVTQRFMDGACKDSDPRPELVAEARQGRAIETAEKSVTKGEELARKANEAARAEGGPQRSGLGSSLAAGAATTGNAAKTSDAAPAITLLNRATPEEPANAADVTKPDAKADAKIETASVAGAAKLPLKADVKPDAKAAGACRVWQASYGGERAIIVKARDSGQTNYTVLDVNAGTEKREAEAYIAAYAKGGEVAGEFASQDQALAKAFELCPEG